jgi:small subunit ribosomal protein S6
MDETSVKTKASGKNASAEAATMRDFEMVLIIKPELDEARFNATLENVKKMISGLGGTVSEVQPWGKRKLSYTIKGVSEGAYVLTRFKMEPSRNRELEAKLRITDDVARHMLIKLG